jgi:hypothetical protein
MAATAFTGHSSNESPSDSSPYTTSSDDLFADINWPDDEPESPFDQNQCFDVGTNDYYENESSKVC